MGLAQSGSGTGIEATFRSAAGTTALLLAVTALFAVTPWSRFDLAEGPVVVLAFLVGLIGTAAMVFHQAMAYRRAANSGSARLRGLLVSVYVAVLFFATAFYLLERAEPGQFAGLATKLDAAYLSLTILSTVGFGDVHAVGQAARGMVCAQIVFDVLVISLAVDAVRHSRAQTQARANRDEATTSDVEEPATSRAQQNRPPVQRS